MIRTTTVSEATVDTFLTSLTCNSNARLSSLEVLTLQLEYCTGHNFKKKKKKKKYLQFIYDTFFSNLLHNRKAGDQESSIELLDDLRLTIMTSQS